MQGLFRKIIKNQFLILGIVLFFSSISVFSQSSSTSPKICYQPFSYEFYETNASKNENLEQIILDFKNKLNQESDEAKGYILFYSGKNTSINERNRIDSKIKRSLEKNTNFSWKSKFYVWFRGYREYPTIEFFIKPLNCSQYPDSVSDYKVDEVEFEEARPSNTQTKSNNELYKLVSKQTLAKCLAAARAVGVCRKSVENIVDVFIIVNTEGKVIFSEALSAHPLLKRTAEMTVNEWEFKTPNVENKVFKIKGIISVKFEADTEEIIDY